MGRPPCCDKSNVKRGLWTPQEDAKLLACISKNGVGNWTMVPKKAGLNRCGKSCRLRWTNYLRPDLKNGSFTPQEEDLIINLHQAIGSRWSLIAKRLPGRTDNDVKNYWNTKLSKKLYNMGIDPVTHKPFSQVFADLNHTFGPEPDPTSDITGLPYTPINSSPTTTTTIDQVQHNSFSMNPSSLDFLGQFQVTSTNQDTALQPYLRNEVTSSCSSSSSSPVTELPSPPSYSCQQSQSQLMFNTPPSSLNNWSEQYFVQEPLQSTEPKQEQQNMAVSCETGKFADGDEYKHGPQACDFGYSKFGDQWNSTCPEASSSSPKSFVDSILDQDGKMRAAFPDFFDGSFDY